MELQLFAAEPISGWSGWPSSSSTSSASSPTKHNRNRDTPNPTTAFDTHHGDDFLEDTDDLLSTQTGGAAYQYFPSPWLDDRNANGSGPPCYIVRSPVPPETTASGGSGGKTKRPGTTGSTATNSSASSGGGNGRKSAAKKRATTAKARISITKTGGVGGKDVGGRKATEGAGGISSEGGGVVDWDSGDDPPQQQFRCWEPPASTVPVPAPPTLPPSAMSFTSTTSFTSSSSSGDQEPLQVRRLQPPPSHRVSSCGPSSNVHPGTGRNITAGHRSSTATLSMETPSQAAIPFAVRASSSQSHHATASHQPHPTQPPSQNTKGKMSHMASIRRKLSSSATAAKNMSRSANRDSTVTAASLPSRESYQHYRSDSIGTYNNGAFTSSPSNGLSPSAVITGKKYCIHRPASADWDNIPSHHQHTQHQQHEFALAAIGVAAEPVPQFSSSQTLSLCNSRPISSSSRPAARQKQQQQQQYPIRQPQQQQEEPMLLSVEHFQQQQAQAQARQAQQRRTSQSHHSHPSSANPGNRPPIPLPSANATVLQKELLRWLHRCYGGEGETHWGTMAGIPQ
ncbi:hypothetical protein HK102_001901 [Quaeritorhiza haematococci]|nr:hypothetical protein HK102_001901 [Quaeritorhiza haematococci]